MRKLIGIVFIFLFAYSHQLSAQIKKGFDPVETKSLIAICNSFTFIDLFGSDRLIIPDNFRKVYTSEVIGLDNLFQVYEGDNVGVLNFRGSTAETSSWLVNFFSAMIPAEGMMKVNGVVYAYKFSENAKAAVHSGYALATVLLSRTIIEQINILNAKGIYHIYITGHSQGGALAHMVRAYLANLPEGKVSSMNIFKIYSFANPMCGNKEFSIEYNRLFSEKKMSFSVINSADFITKLPMNFNRDEDLYVNLFYKGWADLIRYGKNPNLKDNVLQLFEPAIHAYIGTSNYFIERLIASSYISIDLPNYVSDINYFHVGAILELAPFTLAGSTTDTPNISPKEDAKLKQDKKRALYQQHKPYNYYVAILKEYFYEEYKSLEYKYLPSNKTIKGRPKLDLY